MTTDQGSLGDVAEMTKRAQTWGRAGVLQESVRMHGPFPVLVLSPGRSGSSTVAKWLIDLGVNMGARFRAADETNPTGYWEDLDWRDLNDAFLRRVMPEAWYRRLAACWLIDREVAGKPWGVKDPRLCHVVRIWLDIIVQEPAMGIRFIRLHRNPRKVAKSMTRCYGFPHEEAMRVIRERADLLDRDLEGQTVLDIQFPDIVSGTAWAIIKDWL